MARFSIKQVDISDIAFTEKNANFMDQVTFNQLVSNLKRDGELSSVPFTIYHSEGDLKGKYEVISGNHRVKAAEMAGIRTINVMWVDACNITNDEKRAIQLSHNSIHGQDDKSILKELLDEISSTEYKEYSHIDESVFEDILNVDFSIVQPKNEVVKMSFTFFSEQHAGFEELMEELSMMPEDELSNTYLLPKESLEPFNKAVAEVQKKYKIKAYGLAVLKLVEIAQKSLNNESR